MAWSVLRRCYRRCFECLGCGTTRGDRGDAHSSTPLVPSSPRHPKRCLGHPRAKRSFGPARFAATRSLRSGVSVTPPTHVSTASVGRQSNVPGGAASLANPLFGRNASLEHGGLTSARSLRIGTRAGWLRHCFECLGCGTTRGDRGDAHSSIPLVPASPRHPKRCLGHPAAPPWTCEMT